MWIAVLSKANHQCFSEEMKLLAYMLVYVDNCLQELLEKNQEHSGCIMHQPN